MLIMLIYWKEYTDALVFASTKVDLVNADKTKYMVMSRNLNAGRIHIIDINSSSCERVQIFGNNFNRSKFYSGRN
jgi:hypothetical protein